MCLAAPGSLRMTQGSCYKEDGLAQFVSARPLVQKVLSLIPKRDLTSFFLLLPFSVA